MRKTIKKIIKIGLLLATITSFFIVAYMVYVFSNWNRAIDQEALNKIMLVVEETAPQDDQLVAMYNSLYDGALEQSLWLYLWRGLNGKQTKCPCLGVVKLSYIKKGHDLAENSWAVAAQLGRRFTQRQCLDYILANYNFMNNTKGVKEAANFYFQKDVSALNDDERLGLIVMLMNASLYNPKRFKVRYDKKVDEMKRAWLLFNHNITQVDD